MSTIWSGVLILVIFLTLASFQNCGGRLVDIPAEDQGGAPSNHSQKLSLSATVMKADLDGCNFLICANDAQDGQTKCFIPRNIDPTLLNDGNVVHVDGTLRSDIVTTCMAGAVLQVNNSSLVSGTVVAASPTPTPSKTKP